MTGPEPSPTRRSHFVQSTSLPSTLTHSFGWNTGTRNPDGRSDLKGLLNAFHTIPSPPPGASADRTRRAGCVRVCMYVFFRGWLGPSVPARVRVQMCWGCLGLRTQARAGYGEEEAPHACAEIWPHRPCVLVSPRAQMQGRPAPRDTRARERWNRSRAGLGSTWGWRACKPGV